MSPRQRLLKFMLERHQIYLRRAAGEPKPWTDDAVLQQYRFCNVYRELDTVTIWIRKNIREPYAAHPSLWFMLCVARQINLPETLAELMAEKAFPDRTWDPARARKIMLARQARGDKVYTSAYMLNAHGRGPNDPSDKAFFTCHLVLDSVWRAREKIRPVFEGTSAQEAHYALLPYHGWGGFTAYEVVSDARHTRYGERWRDVESAWAHAGPGAIRGLNRIAGREVRGRLETTAALIEMQGLLDWLQVRWPYKPGLEMREVEHSLCEFDKYMRAKLGEGRPKALYPGV